MGKKTKRQARRQAKAQEQARAARQANAPPGPVAVECVTPDGARVPAICFPPEPRWIQERGRWRVRHWTQRTSVPLAARYARLDP